MKTILASTMEPLEDYRLEILARQKHFMSMKCFPATTAEFGKEKREGVGLTQNLSNMT